LSIARRATRLRGCRLVRPGLRQSRNCQPVPNGGLATEAREIARICHRMPFSKLPMGRPPASAGCGVAEKVKSFGDNVRVGQRFVATSGRFAIWIGEVCRVCTALKIATRLAVYFAGSTGA